MLRRIKTRLLPVLLALLMVATLLPTTAMAYSDATLGAVLGQVVTPGGGSGAQADPETVSVHVPYSAATVAAGDFAAYSPSAVVAFYGESAFGSPESGSVALPAGGAATVYLTLTNGTTVRYYAVTINRSADAEDDAVLAAVCGQAVSPGAGSGTPGDPETASVSVPSTTAEVGAADFAPNDPHASVAFYGTNGGFTVEDTGSVSLTLDVPTLVYVKITAEDGTQRCYSLTVTRSASLSDATLSTVFGKPLTPPTAGDGSAATPFVVSMANHEGVNPTPVSPESFGTADPNASVTFERVVDFDEHTMDDRIVGGDVLNNKDVLFLGSDSSADKTVYVCVTAADHVTQRHYQVDINVLSYGAKAPIFETTSLLPDAFVGDFYQTVQLSIRAERVHTYIVSGALPPGITMPANGVDILGRPTQAGTYTFTVEAVTSGGCAYRDFTIVVHDTALSPLISSITQSDITPVEPVTLDALGINGALSQFCLPPTTTVHTTAFGDINARVNWTTQIGYNWNDPAEQHLTVTGRVLFRDDINSTTIGIDLPAPLSLTILPARKLVSVIPPAPLTGVPDLVPTYTAGGLSAALGLPSTVTLATDVGNVSAAVNWVTLPSPYSSDTYTAQHMTIYGTVVLPARVINPDNVSLSVSISVSTVGSGTPDSLISGVLGNGVDDLTWWDSGNWGDAPGTPCGITFTVPYSKASVDVSDFVAHDSGATLIFYGKDGSFTTPETGSVLLPAGETTSVYILDVAENPLYFEFYRVNIIRSAPISLTGITPLNAITGVANGTAKTASALGLPPTVTLTTDGGDMQARVTWDVTASSYDPSDAALQTFTVNGTAALPNGVFANGVSLTASVSVTVCAGLGAPDGLAWDNGRAKWGAVANASSYTVQLYRDGAPRGGPIIGLTDTTYNLLNTINAAGSGDFTFTVTAAGDGVSYSDSAPSAVSPTYTFTAPGFVTPLDTPANLAWDPATPGKATWRAVDSASGYDVQLYKDDTPLGVIVRVPAPSSPSCDFTSAITSAGSGIYTFTVTAAGNGAHYTDSARSAVSPAYTHATTLAKPGNIAWDPATPGRATWDAVDHASGYDVNLREGGSREVGTYHISSGAENYYDFTSIFPIYGEGFYIFRVTATGDGVLYTNSGFTDFSPRYYNTVPQQHPVLDAPVGLAWSASQPGEATWSKSGGGTKWYTVQLYKGGAPLGGPITGISVFNTYYNFSSVIAAAGDGDYTFKVAANSVYSSSWDSPQSEESPVYVYTGPTWSASVSPANRTFQAAAEGYGRQTAQELTVTNTGTGTITGLTASLPYSSDFEISTDLYPVNLGPGGTTTVSVRPKTGLAANIYTDTLTITGSNGISLTAGLSFTVNPAGTPTITGPTALALMVEYGATSTGQYTVGGTAPVTVTKTSGDPKITWNDATQKLDIAAGLAAGNYQVTLKAANGTSPDATLTFTLTVSTAPVAPEITGPTTLTLTAGYGATSTAGYAIGGTAPVTVTKTSGDEHITWNDATQKLDIAAGLIAGSYPITLEAANGTSPDATLTFTLLVNPAAAPAITGPTTLTLAAGYGATSTAGYTIGGTAPVTVTKFFGDSNITWNDATKKLDIAPGLPVGSYRVTLKAANGTLPDAVLAFTLIVNPAAAPAITGPTALTLTAGYGATSTGQYTVGGTAPVTVTKISGDEHITWNGAAKTLDIASGLAAGSYQVRLKATNGTSPDAVLTFTLTVNAAFVSVTGITVVPATATAGTDLTLSGTVAPATATNQTIVWSVQSAGTTGATVSGNTLSTTAAGTVTVRATITNGATENTNYTQDFDITVNSAFVPVTGITGVPATATAGVDLTLSGTVAPATATNQTIVWSVKTDGGTNASISGSTLSTTAVGTVTVTATITNGLTASSDYTQDFEITVNATPVTAAEISITQSPVKTILNIVTFGLFFNDTIDVSIGSEDSTVDHYEYQIVADGDTFDENDAWTQDDSFSITPNFKGWVYARSVYAGGTTSDNTIKALVVDNTKPTISANYNASAGSITVTVTDSGAGIEAITYQVGSDPLQTIDLEPTTAQPNLTTEHEFTISGLPDGQYDVVIDATDNSGNTANTETVPVDRGGSTVTDASINPTGGDFDLYAPDDVETTITWNDAGSVTDVRAGGVSIGTGSYSVDDIDGSTATLAINQAYLETKPVGSLTLTIVFDQGASATLTIDISDSTPAPVIDATISPESVIYDLAAPGNVSTTITLNSAESVTGVVYGTTPLSTPDAYVVSGSALTIKSDYIDSLGLSDGDTAEFEISFDVGNSATLTVHIENNPTLSDNADLSDLTVGGSTVTGFDPSDEEYDVELPYNTLPGSSAALVGATADNEFASVDITQASSFPGSATVEVTAQDGTPKTYTIHFTLAAAPNVPVESITVTGAGGANSVEVGGTLQMLAAVSPGNATNQDVDWSIEGGSGSATISTGGLLTANAMGTVTVRATAQDGSGEYDDKVITITNAAPSAHSITVQNDGQGTASASTASASPGTEITLTATPYSGYHFKTWQVISPTGLSITGNTFTMPDEAVIVKAIFEADNDGGNNGGGHSGGGGGNSSSGGTKVTIQPDKKPDQPVIAGFSATPTVDGSGHATATIPQQSVADAIAKAQADAKAQGNTANGIGVSLETQNPAGTNSLGIVLTQPTLELLTDSMVRQFEVDGGLLTLDFNLEALKQIRAQSTGDVTISLTPVTEISDEAKTLVGTRAVYNITLSYIRDDKTVNITSLNNGSVTLSIPYTPGQNEAVGYLFGVYIDGNGQATRIPGSTYDANSGGIILDSSHFSVYGVGYTAPSAKFTDISTHWAKESIDYAVGRGLFSGTTETTFSPDTAMSRGMLVTVLGRLAGADVSGYKTSSFTDVKTDSAFLSYIEWAYKKGIIQGIGNSQFAPDRAITREEIAVIFANYAKATGYTLPVTREVVTFTDGSSIGSSAKDAVKAMQQAGIMSGKNNGYFDPKGSATRAEVATMLQRYIKLTINPATAQGWALNDAGQYIYYKNAKVLTGWQTIDGVRYYFYSTGILQTGWVKDGNSWRYYSGNKALIGWWNIGSGEAKKIYYFTTDGIMVSGKWLQIDGKWYYFYADGALAVSTKIDGYEVDENGTRKTQ